MRWAATTMAQCHWELCGLGGYRRVDIVATIERIYFLAVPRTANTKHHVMLTPGLPAEEL